MIIVLILLWKFTRIQNLHGICYYLMEIVCARIQVETRTGGQSYRTPIVRHRHKIISLFGIDFKLCSRQSGGGAVRILTVLRNQNGGIFYVY